MRSVVLGSALVPLALAAQVECSTGRYSNYDLFDSISVETVQFGSNTPVSGQGTQALYMDVYQPVGDVLPNRPAVLVAFGDRSSLVAVRMLLHCASPSPNWAT
ncbi:MAG: hypothetical protein IPI55_06850 [Flavobacteriales bacterium]|nr:hypothetical protein [Flavobacteriales bacterium]